MLTPAQERHELLTWTRKAVDYFDSEAESAPTVDDPASLYSEGRVVLRRLEKLTTFRHDEPQGDICKYCGWNRDEHAFGMCPVPVVESRDVYNKDVVAEWLPVATAPRGKAVLVFKSNTQEQYVAALIDGGHGPGWCDQSGCEIFKVTHWRPLPANPT